MRLAKILLKNFRSVREANIKPKQITALVGQNNSGKSSVLRALNSFFNFNDEREAFLAQRNHYKLNAIPRVELTFDNLPQNSDLIGFLEGGKLIIRFEYRGKSGNPTYQYFQDNKYREFSSDNLLELKRHISFVLVPPVRDHSKAYSTDEPLLNEIISEYLSAHTEKRDTLSPRVTQATKAMEDGVLNKISKELDDSYLIGRTFNFKVAFPNRVDYTHILHGIHLEVNDGGNYFDISDCGSGIQSLTIIALYRYLAKIKHRHFILGIEEPETNLHPQAQKELIGAIKSAGSNGGIQVVLTTHSTVVVDALEHEDLTLFRRTKDISRGFRTEARELPGDFWQTNGIDQYRHYQFYKYRNSEFFFAKHIFVVESKTEAEVIEYLAFDLQVDLALNGITILTLDGVKNLKYPANLLTSLDFPYTIIVDKDFFLPYKNDSLDESRNTNGFPIYKTDYKEGNNKLIEFLVPNKQDRANLLKTLTTNHTKAINILEKRGVIPFRYCLEMDLIASKHGTLSYAEALGLDRNKIKIQDLLIQRKKEIKKADVIVKVLEKLKPKNYPYSYKRIRNRIKHVCQNN